LIWKRTWWLHEISWVRIWWLRGVLPTIEFLRRCIG
jgi:hypothetical protein